MIICPNCHHQNPDGAVQCEACFTPLPATIACPSCGAPVQSDASFCGQCGSNLKESPPALTPVASSPRISPIPPTVASVPIDLPDLNVESPGANLDTGMSGAEISYAEISYAEMSYAENTNAESHPAKDDRPDLSGPDLSGPDLSGPDLSGPDLSAMDIPPLVSPEPLVPPEPLVAETSQPLSESLQGRETPFVTAPSQSFPDQSSSVVTQAPPSPMKAPVAEPPSTQDLDPFPNPDPFPDPLNANVSWLRGETLSTQSPSPAPKRSVAPAYTILQQQSAQLVHVQSGLAVTIPDQHDLVHIGKPNPEIPPDIDLSGFPHAEVISRRHADIRLEGDTYFIEDLGSSNGTYVNGLPLRPGDRHRLRHGDRIAFGKNDLVAFLFQMT